MDADWRPHSGSTLIPSYKAHRVADAGDRTPRRCRTPLAPQVPVIEEVLDALGIARRRRRRLRGRRRDRHAATARRAGPVDIVTGDRDLFQLVDDAARGARPLHRARASARSQVDRRGRGARRSTASRPRVRRLRRRCAATPATGCRGWPGVGEKTAAALLTRYGSLGRCSPPSTTRRPGRSRAAGRKLPRPPGLPGRGADGRRVAARRRRCPTYDDALPESAGRPGRASRARRALGPGSTAQPSCCTSLTRAAA